MCIFMSADDQIKIMQATIKTVFDLLQDRLNNRVEALNALENAHMDNIPDQVKQMREVEAGKIRAVMQEQKDLITILKAIFPQNA
jgi:hypothetical protein